MFDFGIDLPDAAFGDIDSDGIMDAHDYEIDSDFDGINDSFDSFVDSDGDWAEDGNDFIVDRDGDWIDDRSDLMIDADGDFVKDGLLTTTSEDWFLDTAPTEPIPSVDLTAALSHFNVPSPF